MDLSCSRPIGDPTTILDTCDRDDQDDYLFPLDTNLSWFVRNSNRRVLPFSTTIQEFPFRGPAKFGSKFQFDIGRFKSSDLLFGIMLQIKLPHWFPTSIMEHLRNGTYIFKNPRDAWFYANSIGSVLIEKAELCLEDQTLEIIDSDFLNISNLLYNNANSQYGIANDALGIKSIPRLLQTNPTEFFPTEDGWISCILPFSFYFERLRASFPLLSLKEGTIRVNLTLRHFNQCIRSASGNTENDTPLGKTFTFIDKTYPYYQEQIYTTSAIVPDFQSVRLVTYGVVIDGNLRQNLIHNPFDRIFRSPQIFKFDEKSKYTATVTSKDTIQIQLPLECNGPIEEIVWVIRRKAVSLNNEWTNYSSVLESEYDPVFAPFGPLLVDAKLQINGEDIVYGHEDYYRQHIAKHHKGGIIAYNNYIYGYCFANTPDSHDPSGWFNASRTTDIRLRLTIKPPGGINDREWEVYVYCMGINWVRFQNGLANMVFSS
jgi:hypothetical protein